MAKNKIENILDKTHQDWKTGIKLFQHFNQKQFQEFVITFYIFFFKKALSFVFEC